MRAWLCAALLAACGGGHSADDQDAGNDGGSIDTPVEPGWTALIERSWSLPSHYELHMCRVIQVPADMYISGYRLVSPTGTHHTVLSITPDTSKVGNFDCTPSPEPTMLYAGGINTNDLVFPDGVAVKLSAGQYIRLELHLFNPSDSTISGTSGVHVKTVTPDQVANEGDMIFLGNIGNWMIPMMTPSMNIQGSCAAPTSWHLFSMWPHMHNIGTHQKVTVKRSSNATIDTLFDQDYDMREQKIYGPMDMLINKFDELQLTCTYVNNTTRDIYQGEGSTDEMCLTGLLKYPKGGSMYQCASL